MEKLFYEGKRNSIWEKKLFFLSKRENLCGKTHYRRRSKTFFKRTERLLR